MPRFDTIVVGAGIIGGAISFELARLGQRVLLLDRQQPGLEASWAAAGMLSPAPDSPEAPLLVELGRASLEMYPGFVAEVESTARTKCGYRHQGTIELFFGPDAEAERDSFVADHRRLKLGTEPISVDDARNLEAAMTTSARAAAWLPYEATLEPRLLTQAVLAAAARRGVEIRAHTGVSGMMKDRQRCTGVITRQERITAGHVVVTAGTFCAGIEGIAAIAPVRPIRGQMVALRPAAGLQRTLRSKHGYVVPRTDASVVAGSTLEDAGFEKRVTPGGMLEILRAAVELCPDLASAEIVETWCGLRPDTPDHLPILGPTLLDGLFLATGHYRNGVLLAPITARLIGEWLMQGETQQDLTAFSPIRFVEQKHAARR